ncbi:MAG: T9SS type A sorting domain-containing protein [Bacteroidota bacterium]
MLQVLSAVDSVKIYPACSAGPLPIVLRKFSVTQQGAENMVNWVTETAMQVKDFEVERGTDGRNFFTINRQPASTSAGTNEYNFIDNNFPAGVNFYRLKMIEVGAVIRYSAIIKISGETKGRDLVISPNPIIGNFSVRYNALSKGPVVIRISDINGRIVNTVHETVNKGQNLIYLQNMPTWKPGIYLLTISRAMTGNRGN